MTRREVEQRVVRDALKAADCALTDWVRSYAPELCDSNHLRESSKRVYEAGGTLAYIAGVRMKIKAALSRARGKGRK